VVAETTLVRAANAIVLCSVACEYLYRPIITFDGDRDLVDLFRVFEALDDVRIDVEVTRSMLELTAGCFESGCNFSWGRLR
jgi:hypothetical protein